MTEVAGAHGAAEPGLPPYLASLSRAQYDAVTASPEIPLQILAGPGSGKTRVLVARVTWLILANGIRPNDLVVVTFTNKAANEMRQRLQKLIGPERTANLILGECEGLILTVLLTLVNAHDAYHSNFLVAQCVQAPSMLHALAI
jgi:superfamily I DNA/RNA helicase